MAKVLIPKILVIEDDANIRHAIVQALKAEGHETLQAKDGREGLRLFQSHRPTLVITDILMPEKDGLEVIRELRGEQSKVPIIAMSDIGADQSTLFLELAKMLGADLAVTKPVHAPELVEAVRKLLTPRRQGLPPARQE